MAERVQPVDVAWLSAPLWDGKRELSSLDLPIETGHRRALADRGQDEWNVEMTDIARFPQGAVRRLSEGGRSCPDWTTLVEGRFDRSGSRQQTIVRFLLLAQMIEGNALPTNRNDGQIRMLSGRSGPAAGRDVSPSCRAFCGALAMWFVGISAVSAETDVPLRLLPPLTTDPLAETGVDEILETPPPRADLILEASPLTADLIPGWIQPTKWFSSPVWDFGMELGVNGSEGNTQSFSLLASSSQAQDGRQHAGSGAHLRQDAGQRCGDAELRDVQFALGLEHDPALVPVQQERPGIRRVQGVRPPFGIQWRSWLPLSSSGKSPR